MSFEDTKDISIYGIQPVIEALNSGKTIQKVFVKKGEQNAKIKYIVSTAREKNIAVSYVDTQFFRKLGSDKKHQYVSAFISPIPFQPLNEIVTRVFENGKIPKFVLLDGITDTNNFGSIVRSAECFGVHGIIIKTDKSAPINAQAVKTSSGAILHIPICRERSLISATKELKNMGMKIVAASEKSKNMLLFNESPFEKDTPICLVMGSESRGISREVFEECDYSVKIPITGNIASLNVASATAIMLFSFFGNS